MKQHNKKYSILIISSFFLFNCFAQNISIKIAPLITFNETDSVISDYNSANNEIMEKLQSRWFEGLISFASLNNEDSGNVQSIFDAVRVCEAEKCDYLLYGYLKQTDYSITAEIKLFNRITKHIEKTFFSSDSKDEYMRLIDTISSNIADYLSKQLSITLDNKDKPIVFSILSIPFSTGYWTHMNSVWNTHLLGTIRVTTGVFWQPPFYIPMLFGKKCSLYFEPNICFKYAIGNTDFYPANYYSIEIIIPVFFEIHFNNAHALALGVGPLYELNFLNIIQKYEDASLHIANDFGLVSSLVYDYTISKNWNLTSELLFGFPFSENAGTWVSLNIGARIKIKDKEIDK